MVSTCLDEWSKQHMNTIEGDWIQERCMNDTFPPVTNVLTGMVYRNEYCALCNGVLQPDIARWSYRLRCSALFYNMLRTYGESRLTLENLEMECQPCSFVEPDLSPNLQRARPCFPTGFTSCLNETTHIAMTSTGDLTYSNTSRLCMDGPYSMVTTDTKTFRNQYCALCNGVSPDILQCFSPPDPFDWCLKNLSSDNDGGLGIAATDGVPFSLVLDINGDGQVIVHSDVITSTVAISCSQDEIFDPVLSECRPTLCPKGYLLIEGVCSMVGGNDTINCASGLIALNESEHDNRGNGTVFYNGDVYEVQFTDLLGRPVICTNYTQNGTIHVNTTVVYYTYPQGFFALTYVGCSMSVLGCLLILFTYFLFKELRTLPTKLLMNLSAAILFSNFFILIGDLASKNVDVCTTTAILLHFFFLAQFTWMTIMVFEITRTFVQASKLAPKPSTSFGRNLTITYCILGWAVPLAITLVTITVNFTTDGLVLYGTTVDGMQGSCWINHLESAVVAFVVPAAISLLFNGTTLIVSTVLICKARKNHVKLQRSGQGTPFLRLYIAVSSITGLTWIFGFVAILASTSWAWYPFIILNSTQGFVIFVAFLVNKRIGRMYLALLCCKRSVQLTASSKQTNSSLVKITNTQVNTNHITKSQNNFNRQMGLGCSETAV